MSANFPPPSMAGAHTKQLELLNFEDRGELDKLSYFVNLRQRGATLWAHLTEEERGFLGNSFDEAYQKFQTVGIWAAAKGLLPLEALLEAARILGFSQSARLDYFAIKLKLNNPNNEASLAQLAADHDLVVVESPLQIFWRGSEIPTASIAPGSAEYLLKLVRATKDGRLLSAFDFGDSASVNVLAHRKTRLVKISEIPADFKKRIVVQPGEGHRLDIDRAQIVIVERRIEERLERRGGQATDRSFTPARPSPAQSGRRSRDELRQELKAAQRDGS